MALKRISRNVVAHKVTDAINALIEEANARVVEAPEGPDAPGVPGQIAFDEDYIYVCVAEDTWKRVEVSAWGD